MSYGIIYCAFDCSNAKVYVGQTVVAFEKRKKQHLETSQDLRLEKKWRLFHRVLHKRAEMFEWSILSTVNSQDELDAAEVYWIRYYDAFGDGGYNLNEGGKGHGRRSESTKEKMRLAKLGKKQSPEWIEARRKGMMGRTQSEETKAKLRTIAKEQWARRYAGDEGAVGRRAE